MTFAKSSADVWAVSSLWASTITRMSASVPEGRTSTRPFSPNTASCSATAARNASDAIMDLFWALSVTATLTSTWGYCLQSATRREAGTPALWSRLRNCRAVSSPSPVVACSRKIMCPDCSPPMA